VLFKGCKGEVSVSPRVVIRKPVETDWEELVSLRQRSQDFHFPWVCPPFTEEGGKAYIKRCQNEDFEGLLICTLADMKIVGVANLSQIFYGNFQNAYLGYYVDVDFAGQGFMTEGIPLVINHAFQTLGLHRIEANIQPGNMASINLVKRLGFIQEGFSRRYLKINEEWCDHERWALTTEDWTELGHV
jgi:[ribosomal protein S5]-alanine N-acetyltransferase